MKSAVCEDMRLHLKRNLLKRYIYMVLSDKEKRKAARVGCLFMIISAVIMLLAGYGAVQLVANHIIPSL